MSQDTKQGVLITQEDVDAALAAFRPPDEDEVGPLFLNESDIVETGSQMDSEFFGLLSKDDIEALLHGDLEGAGSREAQDEIDSLVHTAISEKETPPATVEALGKRGAAQEDVEALIQEAAGDSGGGSVAPEGSPGDGTLIAQDDIDQLLMSALDEVGEEAQDDTADEEFGEVVGQDDIDQLLAGTSDETATDASGGEPGEVVSQNDINQLLAGVSDEATTDTAGEESGEVVSQDDINRLLAGVSDEAEADGVDFGEPATGPGGDAESLISQADLDQLIAGESHRAESVEDLAQGDARSPDEHISQDDINRLLKESFEEEVSLAEDDVPAEAVEEGEVEEPEPVILAADEEASPQVPPEKVPKSGKAFQKIISGIPSIPLKHLAWIATVVIILVCVPLVIMTREPQQPAPEPEVLTFHIPQAGEETPDVTGPLKKSIHFPGFVVLVPNGPEAATYVAADLTLEVSDTATVAVIKENEPVVRDIIYGAISDELKTQDISAIDEASLELAIRKALGRIVTRGAIDRIAFDSLSLV